MIFIGSFRGAPKRPDSTRLVSIRVDALLLVMDCTGRSKGTFQIIPSSILLVRSWKTSTCNQCFAIKKFNRQVYSLLFNFLVILSIRITVTIDEFSMDLNLAQIICHNSDYFCPILFLFLSLFPSLHYKPYPVQINPEEQKLL